MIATWRYLREHPLNRGRPVAALWRWLRWQARSRLHPGVHEVPFVDDTVLAVERGMTGATGNIYCGLHEYAEMAFALHLLRAGDLFIDVGANVGSYSVLAAGACDADVIAYEPIERSYDGLRRNITANGLSARVRACRFAVGDASGETTMTTHLGPMNRIAAHDSASIEGTRVTMVRLDDALAKSTPLLVKIDVEGHESGVLRGAGRVLANSSLRALIVELGGDDREAVIATLRGHGFSPYGYDPRRRVLTATSFAEGGNQILVRDLAFVAERVQEAPAHRIRATGTVL